jgi:hypothetical protein
MIALSILTMSRVTALTRVTAVTRVKVLTIGNNPD